ncbi:MAG: alpha-amylase, partial [Haliea sp.]
DLMRRNERMPAFDGELRFDATHALDDLALPANAEIRRIAAEQSNSSLVVGDTVVLKVLRKLSEGVHPEAEMGRFLTLHGFTHMPAMLGEVSRVTGQDGKPGKSGKDERYTLMVMQRFIHNQGDGWQWTLNTLQRTGQSGSMPGLDATGNPTVEGGNTMQEFTAFASSLGQRLGEMHRTLATAGTEPAFEPEAASKDVAGQWAADALAQLDAAFAVLDKAEGLAGDDEAAALALVKSRKALQTSVKKLATAAAGALCIRIHGDFHLGQVLVSSGDVFLVDFEGEPAKPLEERRAKASPWRDVAGLLRSFDYAAAFAARSDADHNIASGLFSQYLDASSSAFLDAYRQAMPEAAGRGAEELLQLFTLQKAAYEVCYEAANRPTWIGVPLQGLARLAATLVSGKDAA